MKFTMDLYTYRATPYRVIDGDTVEFMVDLGFGTYRIIGTRLARINAPEKNRKISREDGLKATEALTKILDGNCTQIYIKTEKHKTKYKEKTGKYGRWIVEIFIVKDESVINVNDLMVENKHAIYQEY